MRAGAAFLDGEVRAGRRPTGTRGRIACASGRLVIATRPELRSLSGHEWPGPGRVLQQSEDPGATFVLTVLVLSDIARACSGGRWRAMQKLGRSVRWGLRWASHPEGGC